jgi:hypothetical protein
MRYLQRLAIPCAVLLASALPVAAQSDFVRGDCNIDGAVDIGDPIFLLAALFSGGPQPGCPDSCNANDDVGLDIADAVYGLAFLFSSGPPPGAPYPGCGPDPTADSVGCPSFTLCPQAEVCDNGIDDDLDGALDCADSDCAGDPGCGPISHDVSIQPIWTANCTSGCHGPPVFLVGLDLTAGNAYGNLVNVPTQLCAPLDFIEPGDPTLSWLFRKIEGTQDDPDMVALLCDGTSQMPFGCSFSGTCLPAATVDLVEQWILQGAAP